jgi:hypothetical protein
VPSVLIGLLVIAPALADKPSEVLPAPITTTVTAIPLDFDRDRPERKEFGKLVFRGGINLFANTRHFGGYSAMALDASGTTLLAVSDAGSWLRARLDYDGRALKGLGNAVIGPILGKDGRPLKANTERDSEGMAPIGDNVGHGSAYVSFERQERIQRFPFTPATFGPPDGGLALPDAAKRMKSNAGIEAMALIGAGKLEGTLVAFSERLLDKRGNLQGWLIGGPKPGPVTLKRIGGFDITDAAPLPDGGILVLERRFRYSEGIKMRIRRIAASEIRRDALIEGETLLEADYRLNIDNMEAIAVHRRASGEMVITLMSDDNFSPLQRTMILQFTLADGKAAFATPQQLR